MDKLTMKIHEAQQMPIFTVFRDRLYLCAALAGVLVGLVVGLL